MIPITDLSLISTSSRDLAGRILSHITTGVPMDFDYHGGTSPGTGRRVRPTLLFRKMPTGGRKLEAAPRGVCYSTGDIANEGLLYLLAWCELREATRTFRLDRMVLSFPSDPLP